MSKKKAYDERGILSLLSRKNCKFNYDLRLVECPNDTGQIGIHTLGKLDYLTKKCGWHVMFKETGQNNVKTNRLKVKAQKNKQFEVNND